MLIEPEQGAASIVLRANFNPTIMQPMWLARHEVISDEAAENAVVEVIHPEIAAFTIESLFTLRVERDRFQIVRHVAPLILVSDVTCRIFGDLLPHTPIGMMGINRSVHFDVGSAEVRDKIGNTLAPKKPWGKWGEDVSRGEGKRHGGLLSMTLIQKDVDDRPAGSIQAKVEPSVAIGHGRTGIYMDVNDHYSILDPSRATDALEIIDLLRNRFDSSIQHSEWIIDQIMALRDAS